MISMIIWLSRRNEEEQFTADKGLCPGPNIDDVDRGDFLEYHNLIRREIARGLAQNSAGTLKPAKEMYELIYDCALEDAAAKSIGAACSEYVDVPPKHGQNKYTVSTRSMVALNKNDLIPQVVSSWYRPVMVYGLNANTKFDDPRLESFANIAYDKNLGVGCYYAACPAGAPTKAVFACVYNSYVSPNQILYETGKACVDDSECTTYPNSMCLDELCVTPAIVPLPRNLFFIKSENQLRKV
ncbi:hypothetical protein Y032_0815g2497 [Ancylostoma ceylanicum]|nr:hypothetical protein Y032_0815g2497 [Ancylostoma ceylanicum]